MPGHCRPGEDGSSRNVDPASRLRELTDLNPSTQPADPVRMFLPGKTEAEYALRHRLDRAAVMAATAAAHSPHDCARATFWAASELAYDWRLRSATEQQLGDVIHALAMMLAAARAVERTDVVDG